MADDIVNHLVGLLSSHDETCECNLCRVHAAAISEIEMLRELVGDYGDEAAMLRGTAAEIIHLRAELATARAERDYWQREASR